MPSDARKDIYLPNQIGTYHCHSRCVQRAYLCGFDQVSGQNFDHRKSWIQERTAYLSTVFAIDVLDLAILDNHMHHVLRNRPDIRSAWSNEEVARRWLRLRELWTPNPGVTEVTEDEVQALLQSKLLPEYRRRLGCLSWFMKELKEPIAKWANRESNVTGCFWSERFRSTRLLDEAAVLACSIYVDLNVIRAGQALTPETSQFTSAFHRIQALMEVNNTPLDASHGVESAGDKEDNPNVASESEDAQSVTGESEQDLFRLPGASRADAWLAPIESDGDPDNHTAPEFRASDEGFLSISTREYLQLLDWSGRELKADKRGAIPHGLAPIFQRLGIRAERWGETILKLNSWFPTVFGAAAAMKESAQRAGKRWHKGIKLSRAAFT